MNMIKPLLSTALVLSMLCPCAYAQSKIIPNYDQLVTALQQGENVRAMIYLDQCQLKKRGKLFLADITGAFTRMDFTQFGYYKVLTDQGKDRYAAAASYTTMTEHRDYGLITGYARIRIFDDNTGEFHVSHYDAKTLELRDEMNFICKVASSKAEGGMVLYQFS